MFSDVQTKPAVFKSVPVVACPIETKKREGLVKENEQLSRSLCPVYIGILLGSESEERAICFLLKTHLTKSEITVCNTHRISVLSQNFCTEC